MKIAVPVKNEALDLFANAGHAPFFAIFEMKGGGMFKTFDLCELRDNPRVNMEAEQGCQHDHDHDNMTEEEEKEHEQGHNVLATLVEGCNIFLTKKACKHTAETIKAQGVEIRKIPEEVLNAKNALQIAVK